MDLSQLVLIAVAVAGAVIVGLLAIVPTLLELPRRHESTDRHESPMPLTPRDPPTAEHDHRMAA